MEILASAGAPFGLMYYLLIISGLGLAGGGFVAEIERNKSKSDDQIRDIHLLTLISCRSLAIKPPTGASTTTP